MHGSSLAVAAPVERPIKPAKRVLHLTEGTGVVVGHADFLPIIEEGSTAEGKQKSSGELRDGIVMFSVSIAMTVACQVMIAEKVKRPAVCALAVG